jgi:hypothetical protein
MAHDARPALTRALEAADRLKPGTWESVEALAFLAVAAAGTPEAAHLLQQATTTAAGLKAGSWEGVRALAVLARAEREVGTTG